MPLTCSCKITQETCSVPSPVWGPLDFPSSLNTQGSAGPRDSSTSPRGDDGPPNSPSWVSWPEVYSGAGVESQDIDQTEKGQVAEPGRGLRVPPGRGRHTYHRTSIVSHQRINTQTQGPTPSRCLTPGKPPRDFIPGRIRGGVAGATPSRKLEANSGVVWVLPHPRERRNQRFGRGRGDLNRIGVWPLWVGGLTQERFRLHIPSLGSPDPSKGKPGVGQSGQKK